jgi:hypothetical protein
MYHGFLSFKQICIEIVKLMTNKVLYYAAAGTTGIAGILHLVIVPNVIGSNINQSIDCYPIRI